MWPLLAAGLTACALAVVLTRVALFLAPRWRFLDRPGSEAHKQHAAVVPYGGGPAMGIALAVALAVTLPWASQVPVEEARPDHGPLWPILVGAVGLLFVGLWDDRRALGPKTKLVLQTVFTVGAVWLGDLGIDSLRAWPWLSFLAAWGWLVLVTNAFNLLDHADGVSGGCAVVCCVVLVIGALLGGDVPLALLFIALGGALLGYLFWNAPPARIYMGDAGALPLGFLIGVGTLSITFWPAESSSNFLALLSPLIITAIPLFDTGAVIVKRLRRGKPIMQGDRNHISHRLGRLGLSPKATMATVVSLQVALAGSVLSLRSGDLASGVVVILTDAAILLAVVMLETARDEGPR